jgi:hypothetical protein
MNVQKEVPTSPVPDTFKPLFAKEYTVRNNDSWERLANALHIHPWDLIDFNFPGMKAVWRIDTQRACRQINWYLFEYLGCEKSTDRYNYDFSSGLSRGRGVHRGGKIFLPIDGAAANVRRIDLPNAINSPGVAAGLIAARARLSTEARSLHPVELALAKVWFKNSLVYEDIYVSDAEGVGGRSFTIALPLEKRWIVVLNLGPKGFNDPGASNKVLIHQLAHAWQSQHHPLPWQFMVNSYQCQREAAEATIRTGRNASAFAYVPGGHFEDYAGEQVAQQLEDLFYPPGGVRLGNPFFFFKMSQAPPGVKVRDNMESLGRFKNYEYQDTPDVVWHPAY